MKSDANKKRRKYIIIALLLLLLIGTIVVSIIIIRNKDSESEPQGGEQIIIETDEKEDSDKKEPEEKPVTEEVESEETTEDKKTSSNQTVSKPVTNTPTETPVVTPTKTDPTTILNTALANLSSMKGNSKQVASISNPASMALEVSDTEGIQEAATQIVNAIKSKLGYNEATADGTVPVGNPNPFSYDYRIVYTGSTNGKHYYTFEYRFRQYYNVAEKGYDTNQLVADITTYLTGQGKTKFDYQTAGAITDSQPVIIPLDDDYNTALEKAKGQVTSVCSSYRNFDFTYRALTVAGRGQTETTALMFYIYCK